MAIRGTGGDDTLTGSSGNDNFLLWQGGGDTVDGGDGNDIFRMGAALNAGDKLDGGTGTDYVILSGDYSAGVVFNADTIANIEVMGLAGGHSYNLTLNDGNVAAGQRLLVKAGGLGAGNTLTFDGSAETDGKFYIIAGAGDDTLTGGARHDVFDLSHGGNDTTHGGGGNDTFLMGAAFNSGDVIDGGAGNDTLELSGDYSAGLTFGASTITNVETLKLDDGFSYKLTTNDGNVASGATLNVDASALTGSHALTFDGSAETDGFFAITGGAGDDDINLGTTYSASDSIGGGAGSDVLEVGGSFAPSTVLDLQDSNITGIETVKVDASTNLSEVIVRGEITGGAPNLTIDASAASGGTTFELSVIDTPHVDFIGGTGDDTVIINGNFNPADGLDGGGGSNTLSIAAGSTITFADDSFTNFQTLSVVSSATLTMADGNVAAGATLVVAYAGFGVDSLVFDGSAETDGHYDISGVQGSNDITGGALSDTIHLLAGHPEFQTVHGGGGDDLIAFAAEFTLLRDVVDGGAGDDTLELHGTVDHRPIDADNFISVENIVLDAGADDALGFEDSAVAAGATLTVDASALGAANHLSASVAGDNDSHFVFIGGAGDDTIIGGGLDTSFDLSRGGNDTATGGDGNDTFSLGGTFNSQDQIDGGAGTDTVNIAGMGDDSIFFTATTMANVEKLVLAAGHFYSLVTDDATVASGATLTVDASALGAADTLTFDGSAETDGTFHLLGGAGDDVLEGGNLGDTLTGNAGADTFLYTGAAQSSSTTYDTITDFAAGTDHFDVTTAITNVFAVSGSLDSGANFDTELSGLGAIQASGATVVTVTGGTLAGHTFLVIDGNGDDIYTPGQDYVFDITNYTGTITTGDFI